MHIHVKRKCSQLFFFKVSVLLQFAAVFLQQLEIELAEDLKEIHICVLLQTLLWLLKRKTYAVPGSAENTQAHSPSGK